MNNLRAHWFQHCFLKQAHVFVCLLLCILPFCHVLASGTFWLWVWTLLLKEELLAHPGSRPGSHPSCLPVRQNYCSGSSTQSLPGPHASSPLPSCPCDSAHHSPISLTAPLSPLIRSFPFSWTVNTHLSPCTWQDVSALHFLDALCVICPLGLFLTVN